MILFSKIFVNQEFDMGFVFLSRPVLLKDVFKPFIKLASNVYTKVSWSIEKSFREVSWGMDKIIIEYRQMYLRTKVPALSTAKWYKNSAFFATGETFKYHLLWKEICFELS